MATPAESHIPEGMGTITPQLIFAGDCAAAVAFYQKAFGATLCGPPVTGPDGQGVIHALLQIGDSRLMMNDAWPGGWEQGPVEGATAGLFLYVEDCDAAYDRAVAAGCEALFPVADMFWGDRTGKVKDPFGHCWVLATYTTVYTPEEIAAGQKAWLDSIKPPR